LTMSAIAIGFEFVFCIETPKQIATG
jgi:hypothetical protein